MRVNDKPLTLELTSGIVVENLMMELTTYAAPFDKYPALVASYEFEGEEEPLTPLSVNLSGYGEFPEDGCVFLKDYMEWEGLTDALVEAGFAEVVRKVPIGLSHGYEVRIISDIEE